MARRAWVVALCGLLCLGLASEALALSFTFDFLHPEGTASSYGDAIPLQTIGALNDRDGNPIGFTFLTAGDTNADGKVSAVVLLPTGLQFNIQNATLNGDGVQRVMLGLPFPTTGSGQVAIAARTTGLSNIDVDWEQMLVGFGPSTATGSGQLAYAIVFHAGTNPGDIRYQSAAAPGNFNPSSQNISPLPASINYSVTGALGATSNHWTATFRDPARTVTRQSSDNAADPRIGQANTYGYWTLDYTGANARGDTTGFTGTLTAISYSGPGLALPAYATAPAVPIVSNWSFEYGAAPAYPGYGAIQDWNVTSGAGINPGSDGQAPFLNGLPVPDGSRIGFVQRSATDTQSISQLISGLQPGKQYVLQYFEDERGMSGAVAHPSAVIGGLEIVPLRNVTRTNRFRRVISQPFVATAASMLLELRNGPSPMSNDNTALFDSVMVMPAVPVAANAGFEDYVLAANTFAYRPNGQPGVAWTFVGGAGITRNISAFQNGGIPAPEGNQHALFQGNASITQTITGVPPGEYSLSLMTMARQSPPYGNDLEVILGIGTPWEQKILDIDEVTFNAFTTVTSSVFDLLQWPTNSFTLTLRTTLDDGRLLGDRTTFVDDLHFNFLMDFSDIPEPGSAALMLLGLAALRRRRASTDTRRPAPARRPAP